MRLAGKIDLLHIFEVMRLKSPGNRVCVIINPVIQAFVNEVKALAIVQIIAEKDHILTLGGNIPEPQVVFSDDIRAENTRPKVHELSVIQEGKEGFFLDNLAFGQPGKQLRLDELFRGLSHRVFTVAQRIGVLPRGAIQRFDPVWFYIIIAVTEHHIPAACVAETEIADRADSDMPGRDRPNHQNTRIIAQNLG